MAEVRTSRPWKRALAWLAVLGPFFFASYGLATWVSAQRTDVGQFVFAWEQAIPFWPWTIVPYWSIDLLYGLSLLLFRDARELDTHARRLLTAQVVAISCFLLFPLRFSWERPETAGLFGSLFDLLAAFDAPFNQAPSLHIALAVILWAAYVKYLPAAWRWLVHGWFLLIGLSVLTTWQHHFIDVPTGLLLGWGCVWLWPDPTRRIAGTVRPTLHMRHALIYLAAAGLAAALAVGLGGAGLWMLWPALSLAMVALNYAHIGAGGFQKGTDGRLSIAVYWLLAPYLGGAWLNSRGWTWRNPEPDQVADDVWLGRLPEKRTRQRFAAVVDLTAEFSVASGKQHYQCLPALDLTLPTSEWCWAAAQAIEQAKRHGPTLVYCALGYSRSALAVAAWLLCSGRVASADAAIERIRQARPQVLLKAEHRQVLERLQRTLPAPTLLQGSTHASLA